MTTSIMLAVERCSRSAAVRTAYVSLSRQSTLLGLSWRLDDPYVIRER